MTKTLHILILVLISIFLSNCSLFSPVKNEGEKIYIINCVPPMRVKNPTNKTLVVLIPETTSIYDTNEMVYTLACHQISFYAKNRWADTPANMLYPLMMQAIQNTHHFRAIVGPSFTGLTNYVLHTKIIKLEQNFNCCPSVVSLVVQAELINTNTRSIIASKEFCITECAPENNPYGGVLAANRATAQFLIRLADFVSRYS